MIKFIKKKPRPRSERESNIFPILFSIFLLCIVAGIFVFGSWVLGIAKTLPEFDESSFDNQQTSYIYDCKGDMYSNLYFSENRTTVALADMPPYLIDMLIATEDKRFYKHHGIDIKRIGGAFIKNMQTLTFSEGASTLTMQVARNSILNNQEKELTRKVQEALLAIKIERNYSKDDILFFYLNEVFFGHGANGVQAASQLYFGKDVQDISLSEAAMLIGILRNPSTYSPYVNPEKAADIRDVALNNLIDYKPEYETAALAAKEEKLAIQSSSSDVVIYEHPWFTDYVLEQATALLTQLGYSSKLLYTSGFEIYTTLDAKIQTKMEELYANPENFPESNTADLIESAMVIMDPYTGAIKGVIGGREHATKRAFNRATALERQPGSTIKPLVVYAPALERGLAPGSVVIDERTTFGKNWSPGNSNGKFSGPLTMRNAVKNSVNVPAVKFMEMVGIDKAWEFGNEIGLNLAKTDETLSLSLGGLTTGVSPLQMATAYSIFPNMGVYSDNYCIEKITDNKGNILYQHETAQKAVINETSAFLMTDMLVTVTQSGTGTAAKMNRPVASKTGTTSLPTTADFKGKTGNRDAWFAAFTPELVGVVWMGYDNLYDKNGKPQYLKQVYGGKYPAQLWKNVMQDALTDVPVTQFKDPGGWEYASIDRMTGLLAGSTTPQEYIISEKFATGTAPITESLYEKTNICNVSGLLASSVCTDIKQSYTCVNNPLVKVELDANGNAISTVPTAICDICVKGYTNGAYICKDPAHNGVLYLANIAKDGEEGGCPAEMVSFYYFNDNTMPTAHCKIAEHMLTSKNPEPEIPTQPIDPNLPIDPVNPDQPTDPVNPEDPYIPDDTIKTDNVFIPTDFIVTAKNTEESSYAQLSWNANGNDSSKTLYAIIKITNASTKTTLTTYDTAIRDQDIKPGSTYTYMVYATRPDLGTSSVYTVGVSINP